VSPQQFGKPGFVLVCDGDVLDAVFSNTALVVIFTGATNAAALCESTASETDPVVGSPTRRQARDSPTIKITAMVNAAAARSGARKKPFRLSPVRQRIDRNPIMLHSLGP